MVKEYSRQIVLRTQIGYFILIVSVLFIVYIFHFLLSVESPEISDPVSLEVTTNNGPQVIVVATASDGDEIEIPKLDPQEPIPFKPDAIYSNALLAEGSLSNIREKFDSHYELALRGNADSLLIIAEVIGNCLWVAPYDSLEEWEDGDLMQSSLVPEVYLIEIPKLIEGCGNGYINSHIPEGVEYDAWQAQWYKKAAEAGNIYAQLVVSSWEPRSEQNRQNRVELLNKAVRLEDYRAFYHAAQLHVDYFKYGVDDPENLTSHV